MVTSGRLKGKIGQRDFEYLKIAYGRRMVKDPFSISALGLTLGMNNTLKLASFASTTNHSSEDPVREVRAIPGSSLILTTGGFRSSLDADGHSLWSVWNAGLGGVKYDLGTLLKQQRVRYLDGLNELGPGY